MLTTNIDEYVGILVNICDVEITRTADPQFAAVTALMAALRDGCPSGWTIAGDAANGVITVTRNPEAKEASPHA
jgi:hypothetical protein